LKSRYLLRRLRSQFVLRCLSDWSNISVQECFCNYQIMPTQLNNNLSS
jgi:hypothetical protein